MLSRNLLFWGKKFYLKILIDPSFFKYVKVLNSNNMESYLMEWIVINVLSKTRLSAESQQSARFNSTMLKTKDSVKKIVIGKYSFPQRYLLFRKYSKEE